MKLIPAIDLIGGENVRLTQGDYDTKEKMKRTPQEAVQFYSQFEQVGRIHVVDLMGALNQEATEMSIIQELKSLTELPFQIGGGLRTTETIDQYDQLGIDYFILGTRAILDIDWLKEVVSLYPGRIIVGIDAKGLDIYVNGWTEKADKTIPDYLLEIEDLNLKGIVYTDIDKDGMNEGPNFEQTEWLSKQTKHPVIASGGIRGLSDLKELAKRGIQESIVGKATHQDEFWEGIK